MKEAGIIDFLIRNETSHNKENGGLRESAGSKLRLEHLQGIFLPYCSLLLGTVMIFTTELFINRLKKNSTLT